MSNQTLPKDSRRYKVKQLGLCSYCCKRICSPALGNTGYLITVRITAKQPRCTSSDSLSMTGAGVLVQHGIWRHYSRYCLLLVKEPGWRLWNPTSGFPKHSNCPACCTLSGTLVIEVRKRKYYLKMLHLQRAPGQTQTSGQTWFWPHSFFLTFYLWLLIEM